MFGQKQHQLMVFRKLIQDMVDKEDNLFLEIRYAAVCQAAVDIVKYQAGLVRDQMVPDIGFVFKIEIKSAFGHTGGFHNIGDRGFVEAIVDEKGKCRIQQRFPFLFFVHVYFFHFVYLFSSVVQLPSQIPLD